MITPFALSVAAGTDSVPSPLNSMTSTIAFGSATPATMLKPVAAKTYVPRNVFTPQTVVVTLFGPRLYVRNGKARPSRLSVARGRNRDGDSDYGEEDSWKRHDVLLLAW